MPKTKKTATKKAEKKVKATKPKKTDTGEVVKETAEELLAKLGIVGSVEVSPGEEEVFQVNVQTEESGLLIGWHGEALFAFQVILGLVAFRKLGTWTKVVVEIGDYRARRAEQITAMAVSYANQVAETGQPMALPYLPPAERRVVHLALAERSDVESVSEGEGNSRRVVIKPKNA